MALARALFSPASVALIGASVDPAKLASRPERLLRRHGFAGSIVPVARGGIGGERVHTEANDFPAQIDHAFVMVPAPAVASAIAACGAAGVRVATILSSGFAEHSAAGKRREDALVAAARAAGIRLVGPNSLGVVNVPGRVTLSANAVLEHESLVPGGLSVVSQSGSMVGAIISRAQQRGLGFSKLVAVGNECDIRVGELVHLLVDDPDTTAILLFVEALRDAPVLGQAARRAFAAGKPVIALKLGRSALGRDIAATHTGAIAGADAAADAFFRAHGILRVEVFEALFETAQLVLGHRPPKGRRVGAVTVSGGAAAMVADRLGMAGIDLVAAPHAIVAGLAAKRIRIASTPVVDLPMGRADGGAYAAVLERLLASDHCDLVLAVQGSNAAYDPDSVRERVLAANRGDKPLAVFLGPRADRALRILQDNAVAGFRTPEACADAIRAYCDWHTPAPDVTQDPAWQHTIRRALRSVGSGLLDSVAAAKLIAALGIACAPARVIRRPDEPVDLPYPLAAKVLSPDIAHKTEVGGVALDIPDAATLRLRIDTMLASVRAHRPQARVDGILIQSMHAGSGEVIVGLRRDADVGPVVMIGPGGIGAELAGGHAVRLAPVSIETAYEMIAAVPSLALLRGYRNRPAGDIAALAQALHRLSLLALADAPMVLAAEINPLIVHADGVVAVDALVKLATP
ncbi:MAG: acetate--CoA ligase family protein [Burkholderiales bacterium]|nr:acetate--CoA ligase family protein [Burkholderiales bacterium]